MSIVQTLDGDLLENFKQLRYWGIAHGCNCYRTMGAGIAEKIAKEFPMTAHADFTFDIPEGAQRLGKASLSFEEFGMIFNAYTQVYPGSSGSGNDTTGIRLRAIGEAFKLIDTAWVNMPHKAMLFDSELFGIPMIGAGLARGNWDDISEVIDKNTPNLKIELVRYKG